ncbi:uncharacterized protein [Macrobrachium rosenbergii]|uniref:uncharacterized protein n=1 Tax=Macrobrachium rosenbergii TaxID=79674 RepID=UPI0034D57E26
MSHNKEWVDTTQPSTTTTYSRQVPPGDGEHFVVVAAGTNKGFTEDSFLCYTAKNSSGDYHGEMNAKLFERWLTTKLLPLEEPPVLVINNAPYHSHLTEESHCPTTGTKKRRSNKLVQQCNITHPPHALRPELLKICKENRPPPRFTVDNTIRLWGHEVVRLPKGHPELNAIEQVWGVMKKYVQSSLHHFTRTDLKKRLNEAKLCVTEDVWANAVRRSEYFEREYWSLDNIHDSVDRIIMSLASDNEEEDFTLDSFEG